VELTKQAKEFLAEKGYDPSFGARPLRRALQRYLEDPIAEELLKGKYSQGSKIRVKVNKKTGDLKFTSAAPKNGSIPEEEKSANVS
jgi:ATP-dependent Clp protease ATP-binding subunit ClpC